MAKNSIREASRNARAARLRRTRLLLGVIGILIVFLLALTVYQNVFKPANGETSSGGKIIVTMSGLRYEDLFVGTGTTAKKGDSVAVHYTGWLKDGTQFDSSVGGDPLVFTLGAGMVIPGWDEGVAGMQVGGKRKLYIPSKLGYGDQGYPPVIPAKADLEFEVELVEIR